MHAEHAALLAELRRLARAPAERHYHDGGYLGSGRPVLRVTVPERRALARAWLQAHRREAADAVLALADSLFHGESHEEKTLACLLLAGRADVRRAVAPAEVERWLGLLEGWAEVDSLCQNLFTAEDMLADWPAWKAMVERLSRAPDLNRRRASLVLVTGPVRRSDDPRFRDLAFAMVAAAMGEKDILVTKAVSWLLRAMTANHAAAVAAFLDAEAGRLPAVAVRETRAKLRTGRKSG